jgi:radical SAM protein with 4Fe4S-binding SPASM domain
MTVLIIPTGACPFACRYCFEPVSLRRRAAVRPDVDAILRTLDQTLQQLGTDVQVGLHGGECTTLAGADLAALLRAIAARTGRSAVQTNGYLVTPEMLALFRECNTKISISWDGPPELNRLRGPDPEDPARLAEYNARLVDNLRALLDAGLKVGVVAVLHQANAGSPAEIARMKEWMQWLAELGVTRGRMNPLFGGSSVAQFALDNQQLGHAYCEFFDWVTANGLEWLPYREMVDNLLGFPVSPCHFAGCNLERTLALSILPDGRLGNCDRTFLHGFTERAELAWTSGDRDARLAATECADCRYWAVCRGGCPVSAEGDDPQRKTRFCAAFLQAYAHVERRLRGLLPHVRLVMDAAGDEPFAAMSWSACSRPSSYAPVVWRGQDERA